MPVAIVTDSTAALPAELSAGITVVPLTVVVDGRAGQEGVDVSTADVAAALSVRRATVTTSRPAPEQFAAEYRRLLDGGADGVASIHLSARLSGTADAAALAAADFGDRVAVIDSRSAGMGLGFVVASAAAHAEDLSTVRAAARDAIDRTTVLFYVDTLEHMRRGGRIGAASAFVGTALSVKPILHMSGGEVVLKEKVRTASRALARIVDLAGEFAGGSTVDIAVQHLAAAGRAEQLGQALGSRLPVRHTYLSEVGAVLGAHAGPGLVCAVIHRIN